LDRYDEILRDITEAASGHDVDLLIYTPTEFSRMARRPWKATVLKDGRTIYESDKETQPG
jgi:hypothetical protein